MEDNNGNAEVKTTRRTVKDLEKENAAMKTALEQVVEQNNQIRSALVRADYLFKILENDVWFDEHTKTMAAEWITNLFFGGANEGDNADPSKEK